VVQVILSITFCRSSMLKPKMPSTTYNMIMLENWNFTLSAKPLNAIWKKTLLQNIVHNLASHQCQYTPYSQTHSHSGQVNVKLRTLNFHVMKYASGHNTVWPLRNQSMAFTAMWENYLSFTSMAVNHFATKKHNSRILPFSRLFTLRLVNVIRIRWITGSSVGAFPTSLKWD